MEKKEKTREADNIFAKYFTRVNNDKSQRRVSDREIVSIIKEDKNFPRAFSSRIKLSVLVNYYYKYWNGELSDEENEIESDTDQDQDQIKNSS
jgi:hypothetical protein